MGTPEFASTSLRRLVEEGYNIVAVVTTPDKPAGRGQKMHLSDVKVTAQELGLPILQPEKLRDEEFLQALRDLRPDLGIVIAFRMLPEVVWAMPRLGTFNLHASLLPEYRGAAPINWAIINGEKRTVVADPSMRLLDLIRDVFMLKGTKEGCSEGECGACTVIMDGEAVTSCIILAGQAEGRDIITIAPDTGERYLSTAMYDLR